MVRLDLLHVLKECEKQVVVVHQFPYALLTQTEKRHHQEPMVKVKHYFTMSCEDWTKYLQQEFIQEGDPEFITETYQDTLDHSYMTANVWMKVVEIEDKPTSISLQHSTPLSIHNESISFLTVTCKEQQISSENMLLFFFAKSFLTQICNKSIEIKCGRIRYRSKNCEEVKLTCDQVVFSKDERELPMAIFSLHGEVPRSKLCELFQHSIPTQIKVALLPVYNAH